MPNYATYMYVTNSFVDVTFDDVYKCTPRCDMEIDSGFVGMWPGKYATLR